MKAAIFVPLNREENGVLASDTINKTKFGTQTLILITNSIFLVF